MHTPEWLAEQFEEHRAHLRAVGYRMLGSASEAEDAVQESWIRLGRTDVGAVENLRAWLTTVVARSVGHRKLSAVLDLRAQLSRSHGGGWAMVGLDDAALLIARAESRLASSFGPVMSILPIAIRREE